MRLAFRCLCCVSSGENLIAKPPVYAALSSAQAKLHGGHVGGKQHFPCRSPCLASRAASWELLLLAPRSGRGRGVHSVLMKILHERACSPLSQSPGKDRTAPRGLRSAEAGALRPEGRICLPCLTAVPSCPGSLRCGRAGQRPLGPTALPALHMRSGRRLILVHSDP